MAYCYDGKTYETIKEMAEEYGIDRQRIYSFRRRGWSLEDAMQMCINDVRGRGRLFEYNGKLYRSPKALAEEYGLPWNSLAHYIQRCKTIEEAVDRCKETQEKKIMLWGKRYQSRYALAIAFGIRETSISARIHTRNMTLEEIILELLQKEPICFEGKTYNTLVELCAEYQVQPCNVFERLKYGKTLEEAIYLPIRNNGKRYEIVYEGKVYQNAAFLCREYNISKLLVYGQQRYKPEYSFIECFRLVKQLRDECGWPNTEVFAFIPRCKIQGKFYKRISDFASAVGMTRGQIDTYKSRHHHKNMIEEVENQPTKSQFTKTDATTGEELEGAKLQIIDQDGNIVEEWISTKEPHVVYGLPEGTYTLHEELPPYAEGYVSAEDMEFEVKEDGSVTKVEMKDTYSKVEISKTDLTTGKELEGAKLQILNKEGEVLEEWVTDGKPHLVEKLPVGEELILREITAPEGYEIAEDVKFTLEDTMEVQKVEMKDARTPETPGVPQTGDDHWKQILLFALLGVSAAGLMATMLYKKRHKKADEAKKEE